MKIIPAIFEEREIRRIYDEKTQTWFFSVVDIIQVLTQQPNFQAARKYWKVLKSRLVKEGSELVTNCYQFKLPADDGKMRLTDVANVVGSDALGRSRVGRALERSQMRPRFGPNSPKKR